MLSPNSYPRITRVVGSALGVLLLSASCSGSSEIKNCSKAEVIGHHTVDPDETHFHLEPLEDSQDTRLILRRYPHALIQAAQQLQISRHDKAHSNSDPFKRDKVDNAGDIICAGPEIDGRQDVYYDNDGLELLDEVEASLPTWEDKPNLTRPTIPGQ